jgi:hypothetical protein
MNIWLTDFTPLLIATHLILARLLLKLCVTGSVTYTFPQSTYLYLNSTPEPLL